MGTRRTIAIGGTGSALVIGAGVFLGVGAASGGDDDAPLAGMARERATAAALAHVGAGAVTETATGDDGAAYEVEVRRGDGSQVEVRLGSQGEVAEASVIDGPPALSEALLRAIGLGPGAKSKSLNLDRYHLAETLRMIIEEAQLLALRNGAETIGERFLLRAVLASEREGMVGRCLSSDALGFNLDFMLRDVDKRIRDQRLGKFEEEITPFLIPGAVAKSEDLTYLARTGHLRPSVAQDTLIEAMLRGLYKRQDNHLLITGEAGVGKTALVRELGKG